MKKFGDNITDMYVGTLTADEMTFAGTKYGVANFDNYLMNDNSLFKKSNWTISPGNFNIYNANGYWFGRAFILYYNGNINGSGVTNGYSVRPSINLKSKVEINSGDGTKENPYLI